MTATAAMAQDVKIVFADLNKKRTERGLKPLVYMDDKQAACDAWAFRLTKSLDHSNAAYLSEAISHCPVSEELIIPLFMTSKLHKEILMDKKAKGVCIGIFYQPKKEIVKGSSVEYIPPIYHTVIRTY